MKKSLIGNVPPDKVSIILIPSHTDADGNRIKPPKNMATDIYNVCEYDDIDN